MPSTCKIFVFISILYRYTYHCCPSLVSSVTCVWGISIGVSVHWRFYCDSRTHTHRHTHKHTNTQSNILMLVQTFYFTASFSSVPWLVRTLACVMYQCTEAISAVIGFSHMSSIAPGFQSAVFVCQSLYASWTPDIWFLLSHIPSFHTILISYGWL